MSNKRDDGGISGVERPPFLNPNNLTSKNAFSLSHLTATQGDIKTYRFNKDRIVIGSVVSADMRLSGDGISPIHAVIEYIQPEAGVVLPEGVSKGAVIYDLASDSGVFVNGQKVVTRALKEGDEITLGYQRLRFGTGTSGSAKEFESEGRRLYVATEEDMKPLLLEDAQSSNGNIFDYRPTKKSALEVVMSWRGTIFDIAHFVKEPTVYLGPDRSCHFGIPDFLGQKRFPFVEFHGEEATLHIDPKMTGVIQREGNLRSLDEIRLQGGSVGAGPGGGVTRLPLRRSDFAKVRIAEIDFYLSFTAAPPLLKSRRLFEKDPLMKRVVGISLLLTFLFLFTVSKMDTPQKIEAEQIPERVATILYEPEKILRKKVAEIPVPQPKEVVPVAKEEPKPEPPKPVPPKVVKLDLKPKADITPKPVPKVMDTGPKVTQGTKKPEPTQEKPKAVSVSQNQSREGEGAKAKGQSGTRGSKTATRVDGDAQTAAKRPSPNAGVGRGGSRSEVGDQGNVEMLKSFGGQIQNLLGGSTAQLAKGGKNLEGFGGFNTVGKGGLALSGDGRGGGGTADSLGGLGTKGVGGGRVGTGLGAQGTGSGIIGGKSRVVIRSGGPEEAVVMGAIDADAVEQALLAHKDEFRLCYEREINAETPNIAGRIGTTFVIGSSGRVTSAGIASSSIKNANVERCVVGVIKRIDFPVPRGGGVVQVNYPFKFNSQQ